MRWGLIELHVDVEGIVAPGQTDAVLEGIRRDARRADTVCAALEHARRLGCGFVELPGWTLVSDDPPSWLAELSAGMTVVAEFLRPGPGARTAGRKAKSALAHQPASRVKGSEATSPTGTAAPAWEGYVLHDGHVVGPAPQFVASSVDPWDGEVLSERGMALIRDLQARGPEGRRWALPGVGEALLLLCGEANIVGGGGPVPCRHYETVAAAGLTEDSLGAVRVIANPAHTWSRPQALRDKRAWLSRPGLLLHTANTHSAGWQLEWEEGRCPGQASRRAAAAWLQGDPCDLDGHERDGYVLRTLDWAP